MKEGRKEGKQVVQQELWLTYVIGNCLWRKPMTSRAATNA
jgi:hypothetical protein